MSLSPAVSDISSDQSKLRQSVESNEALKREQMLMLNFHYTRRMADILREEAELERKI